MAASSTEICNMSISWLSGNPILSIDDPNSVEASLCRSNYDSSRRSVLEDGEWTFATKRVVLTPLAETPLFGYSYKFLAPPSKRRIIGVYDPRHANMTNPPEIQWVLEGVNILANIEEIHVKYTDDIINTVQFSGQFDHAVAAHIAAKIAMPLTEDRKQQERMFALYQMFRDDASSIDGLQGSRELLNTSQLENSRRHFVRPS